MRIKNLILLLLALCVALPAMAQSRSSKNINSDSVRMQIEQRRVNRGLVDTKNVFVPKGQWVVGTTVSYSTHVNENYKLAIIEDVNSQGYNFKLSPMLGYAIADNMVVGMRGNYGRTHLRIDSASLSLGEGETGTNISTDFYYALKHSYTVGAIWRQYIPLGRNKRFAIFNEVQVSVGGSQSKFATDSPIRGTFSRTVDAGLSVSPGIVAFASNIMAIEVNVGVMGVHYSRTKQVHNQVETGKTSASYMNFSINLLSIGLGVSFYL